VLGTSLPAAETSARTCTFGSLASAVVSLPQTVHQIYIFAGDNPTHNDQSQAALQGPVSLVGTAARARGTSGAGRVAIVPVDVEFVDEPSLLGHSREECRLIEFLAVPGQWTGRPVLHHTEQVQILHRRVRALEY
jgi:hypothetical protein